MHISRISNLIWVKSSERNQSIKCSIPQKQQKKIERKSCNQFSHSFHNLETLKHIVLFPLAALNNSFYVNLPIFISYLSSSFLALTLLWFATNKKKEEKWIQNTNRSSKHSLFIQQCQTDRCIIVHMHTLNLYIYNYICTRKYPMQPNWTQQNRKKGEHTLTTKNKNKINTEIFSSTNAIFIGNTIIFIWIQRLTYKHRNTSFIFYICTFIQPLFIFIPIKLPSMYKHMDSFWFPAFVWI